MSSEAMLVLGKGALWFLIPVALCLWELWKLRND